MPPRMAAAWRPVVSPSPAASATASRTVGSPMNRASRPMALEPPPTQARARSGRRPSTAWSWAAASSPIRALEVLDDGRVRVRPHRRAQHVVGRLDVGDPVAHRLVDRVLERGRAAGHGAHLGARARACAGRWALALDVLGAHVHDARQVEQGAGGGRGDAVLAGAGLGDDPGLAQAPGQQRLPQRVVDLVGAGVGEVLALEVQAELRDGGGAADGPASPAASQATAPARRSARYSAVSRPAKRLEQAAQVGPERRVVAQRVVGVLELGQGGHQRLGHVAAPEVALHPPATGGVGVEQAGMDRRRAERDVGAVVAGGLGALDEQGDRGTGP